MVESSGCREYVGGLVVGISTVITGHPFDTVKVKLQKHNTEAHGITYRNSLDCTARILKIEGVCGALISFVCRMQIHVTDSAVSISFPTLLGESFGNAVFFIVYEYVRYYMHSRLKFWCAVLPLDGAKTIIEIDPDKSTSRNPFHILSFRREVEWVFCFGFTGGLDLKGCYAGLGPTMVRAFPANAAGIVTWELEIKV
ncbi:hypothetical protein I3760_10G050400 [Carya illinoinensis]|nr:hypothetical protein I3760_10G050400 [Carya illinoinensis]